MRGAGAGGSAIQRFVVPSSFTVCRISGGSTVQIIHAHGYKESVSAALLARRCGIPVQVRTFHGARTPFVGLKLKHRAALLLDRFTTRYCVDHKLLSVAAWLRVWAGNWIRQRFP